MVLFQAIADPEHWVFYIMRSDIYNNLEALKDSDFYPFHMPGHKRQPMPGLSVTELDITEIDGFDNLYNADGLLKESMEKASALYGSNKTFFGLNGSTGSLLIAISAAFRPGDKVLVARNCHKAVYHAIELRGIEPIFIYPETEKDYNICFGIKAEQVKKCFDEYMQSKAAENSPIAGMILTSPTYEGIVSEVREIADFLHAQNGILVVDEAHGAHFGFHPAFPESAIRCGADLVIQSLHKTLPAMTQTSLLHLCSERVPVEAVAKYYGMYQTSSPSYVLMMSMDMCLNELRERAEQLFEAYTVNLRSFYIETEHLSVLKVWSRADKDIGKLVICVPQSLSAWEVYKKLREEYHLQPEMCGLQHVLLMTSVYDTKEGFERLQKALMQIDDFYSGIRSHIVTDAVDSKDSENVPELSLLYGTQPQQCMIPAEAVKRTHIYVDMSESAGKISAEYMYLYPPGIPFIIPGEMIPEYMPGLIEQLGRRGHRVVGLLHESGIETVVMEEDITVTDLNMTDA